MAAACLLCCGCSSTDLQHSETMQCMHQLLCPPLQGIYLNEHRNYGGPRRLVITVQVGV